MAVLSDYVSGTISLTNGSVDFTGSGTSWQLAQIREGDTIFYLPGTAYQGVISEITSNVAGKLDRAWEGPDLVNVEYRIRILSDGSRSTSQSAMLREQLGNGNIQALAGLTGSSQQVPMFTGPGAMTLVPKGDFINGVAVDKRVNNLAERAAYDGQTEGFSVYVANIGDGRAATYFKESAASGDWSDPAYVTGPVGPAPVIEASITQTAPGTAPDVEVNPITGGYGLDFELPLVRGAGFQFQFAAATADANPGAGLWRANNAAFSSATQLFISKTSNVGADVAAFLAAMGTSTSPSKGTLVQQRLSDGATASWSVTGATDATGYVKVAVSGYSGPSAFAANDLSMLQFMKSGNAGAGTGDVVGPASSTANRYARFADATGKLLIDGPNGIPNADLASMAQATIKGRAVGAGTGGATDLTPAQVRAVSAQAWIMLAQPTFSAGTTEFISLLIGAYSYIRIRGVLFPSVIAPLGLRLSQDGGATWRSGGTDYGRAGISVAGVGAPTNQGANADYYYLNTAENIAASEAIEFRVEINNAVGGARIMMECASAHTGSSTGTRVSSRTDCFTAFGGGAGGVQLTMPGATFAGRLLLEGAL